MNATTITIAPEDLARLRSDYVRHSSPIFLVLGLLFAIGVLGSLVLLPSEELVSWMILLVPTVSVILFALILRSIWRDFSRSYPVGSEHSLGVTDNTLDVVGPAGRSHIKWEKVSHLKRSSGAVHMIVQPRQRQLVLPARLVTDEAFAVMVDRTGGPLTGER